MPPRNLAIISSRERLTVLAATIDAAVRACAGGAATIDVVVNGNPALAQAIGASYQDRQALPQIRIRVWSIALGDKAHACNAYVHGIWPGTGSVYFIDGYARINPDALSLLDAALEAAPHALGATAVPTMGASAPAIRELFMREGGIHGNLFAVREQFMQTTRQLPARLPLGLYRVDSLIGAMLCLALDADNDWDRHRIRVVPEASWTLDQAPRFTYSALRGQFRRILRQHQGLLENRAVEHHLRRCRRSPAAFPNTAAELIQIWREESPREARELVLRHPLALHALRQLTQARDWSAQHQAPVLIATLGS